MRALSQRSGFSGCINYQLMTWNTVPSMHETWHHRYANAKGYDFTYLHPWFVSHSQLLAFMYKLGGLLSSKSWLERDVYVFEIWLWRRLNTKFHIPPSSSETYVVGGPFNNEGTRKPQILHGRCRQALHFCRFMRSWHQCLDIARVCGEMVAVGKPCTFLGKGGNDRRSMDASRLFSLCLFKIQYVPDQPKECPSWL